MEKTKEQELLDKFVPEHITTQLPKSAKDLKDEVQKSVEEKEEQEKETTKPDEKLKAQKEYTFQFDWINAKGKRYRGEFTNKILSIREQQLVGLARARLTGGLPEHSFDPFTKEINLIISHLTFSLIKSPTWAENLDSLEEVALLQELYMEVASHEATFFGFDGSKEESKG